MQRTPYQAGANMQQQTPYQTPVQGSAMGAVPMSGQKAGMNVQPQYGVNNAQPLNRNMYNNYQGGAGVQPSQGNAVQKPWSLYGNKQNNQSAQVQQNPVPSKDVPKGNGKELDLDATILMQDEIDLDATMLMEDNVKKISTPVLRSKETGEVVKITRDGFLVGRQKIQHGKVVKKAGERQPDLILPTKNVSHSHAVFTEKDGTWYVTDQESMNGTFVNDDRLEPKKEKALEKGDILRFASEEYEYLGVVE